MMTLEPQHSTEIDEQIVDGDWRALAACRNLDIALFFPEGPDALETMERAKEVCATCPVVDECLAYAIETNQTEGVWGGTTPRERRRLRRRWLQEVREAS